MRVGVEAGLLLERFSQFPHSQPIIETFQHFGNPSTYRGYREENAVLDGEKDLFFGVLSKPQQELGKEMEIELAGDPLGPSLALLFRATNSWGGMDLVAEIRSGWEFVSPKMQFVTQAEIPSRFDPSSRESRWLLEVITYFADTKDRYFRTIAIENMPSSKPVPDDGDFYRIPQEFVASLR